MAKHESDLRFFSNDEINELKNYFHKNGWKYSNLVPSRILKNGIPRTYTKSGFNLPINNSLRYIHRWQIIELLAYGNVIHSKEDCTYIYKPKPDEIRAYHAKVKARRASADTLEGVVDREVVSEGVQTAKAAVGSSEAFVEALAHGTMDDLLKEMKSNVEISNDKDKLLFDRLTMVPETMEVRLSFTSPLTNRYAKVSSLDERSFAEYTGLPKTLDLKARFLILSKMGYELAMKEVGTMNMSGFCGEIGNGNYLTHKY